MTFTPQPNSSPAMPARHTKAIAMVVILVALACAAASVAALLHHNAHVYDSAATKTVGEGMTYEEMVAELDRQANESRLWISVASSMKADAETGAVSATDSRGATINVLDNDAENTRDIAYSFALDDGTQIYQSNLLRPGQSIQSPVLSTQLSPGAYDVTVTAQGYDVESHSAVGGTVAAKATLNVE